VSTVRDVSAGLLCCSIAAGYIEESKRFVPELLMFAHSVLALYSEPFQPHRMKSTKLTTFHPTSLSFLLPSAASHGGEEVKNPWSVFAVTSSNAGGERCAAFIYSNVIKVVAKLADLYGSAVPEAVPELFQPVVDTLRCISSSFGSISLPDELLNGHNQLVVKLTELVSKNIASRLPLQWRPKAQKILDMKAPRYQHDYSMKKDIDPDKDR